jgi:predicted enzyme related to lactoylglutathione lyase
MATQIAAAGGEVLGTRDMGSHGRTLTFRDPVGNIAQLYERAPKP